MKIARYLIVAALAGALSFLWIQQLRWRREQERLRQELFARTSQAAPISTSDAGEVSDLRRQLIAARNEVAGGAVRIAGLSNKVTILEQRIQALEQRLAQTQGQPQQTESPSHRTRKRPWGPEQMIGPPDTFQAGDLQTAWAARAPDSGSEWVRLQYTNWVDVAEVRVRETYHPGAISRVTALLLSGQEISIWEGVEPPAEAPVETAFEAPLGIRSQTITLYLDTSRVSGWNEIDAVELVGRDGSRQWAAQASASSSYADRNSHGDLGIGSSLELLSGSLHQLPEPFIQTDRQNRE
jgi:hypothetical protein